MHLEEMVKKLTLFAKFEGEEGDQEDYEEEEEARAADQSKVAYFFMPVMVQEGQLVRLVMRLD